MSEIKKELIEVFNNPEAIWHAAIEGAKDQNRRPTTPTMEDTKPCELYGHVPEFYDVSFLRCKVCDEELGAMSLKDMKGEIDNAKAQAREDVLEALKNHHALLVANAIAFPVSTLSDRVEAATKLVKHHAEIQNTKKCIAIIESILGDKSNT